MIMWRSGWKPAPVVILPLSVVMEGTGPGRPEEIARALLEAYPARVLGPPSSLSRAAWGELPTQAALGVRLNPPEWTR